MVTFPFGVNVTVVSRAVSGTDSLGNDVFTLTKTVVLGAFAPGGSTELVQGQDIVITQPVAYLPPGTVVGPSDAVQVAGTTYEVDGSPNAWLSPFTGWQPGVEVRLKAVTG